MIPRLISNLSTCYNNDITRHLTTQTGERTVRQMTLLGYEIGKEKVYIIQWSLESYVTQYLDQTSPLFNDHYPHNTSSIHSYYINYIFSYILLHLSWGPDVVDNIQAKSSYQLISYVGTFSAEQSRAVSGLCCNSARKPSGVRRGRVRPAEDQYSRVQLTARPASISTPLLSRTYTVSLYSGSSVSIAVPGRYLWIFPHYLPRCPAVLPGSTPVWPIRAFLCNVHILTDDTQSLHTGGHHHVVLSRPQRTCCDRSEQVTFAISDTNCYQWLQKFHCNVILKVNKTPEHRAGRVCKCFCMDMRCLVTLSENSCKTAVKCRSQSLWV